MDSPDSYDSAPAMQDPASDSYDSVSAEEEPIYPNQEEGKTPSYQGRTTQQLPLPINYLGYSKLRN